MTEQMFGYRTTDLQNNALSEDTNNEMRNIQDLGKIDDIENPYNSQDDDSDANESSEWQDDYNPDHAYAR